MPDSAILMIARQVYSPLFSFTMSLKISWPEVEFICGLPLSGTAFPSYLHSMRGGVNRLSTVVALQVNVVASLQRSAERAVMAMDGTGTGRPAEHVHVHYA